MQGWLVVNAFYKNGKLNDIYDMLERSCAKFGMRLDVCTTADILLPFGAKPTTLPDFVIFWDKDVVCARMLEKAGLPVFNNAHAIELCDNKMLTAEALCDKVPMPLTIAAPKTFEGVGYNNLTFVERAAETLGLPMVIKEAYGSYGQQVYMAHTVDRAVDIVNGIGWKDFLMQQYIGAHPGIDVRFNVVGDKVTSAMLRHNQHDFRSNISNGGVGTKFDYTATQAQVAVDACKTLGLDFAGVDILLGKDDQPYVCEVNSNPHFLSTLAGTGDDVSLHIAEYIANKLN